MVPKLFITGITLFVIFILNFNGVKSQQRFLSAPVFGKVGEFEVFCPSSFRITIPSKIDTTFATFECTHFSQAYKQSFTWFADMRPKNGLLTFENSSTANINIGDVIFLNISLTAFGERMDYTWGKSIVGGENAKPVAECMPWTQVLLKIVEPSSAKFVSETIQLGVFKQKGFELSLPAGNDIKFMTFEGNLYDENGVFLIDTWIADDVRPQNGRLKYTNCTSNIEIGNKFKFEINLRTFGQTQRYMTGIFVVFDYIPDTRAECRPSVAPQMKQSGLESVKVDVFYPSGFQVSIPAGKDITSMTFNGRLNQELDNFGASQWVAYDIRPKNGQLTFQDNTSNLRIGDVIYYRITVTAFEQRQQYPDGVHIVTGYINKVGHRSIWRPPPTDDTSAECKPSITAVNGIQQKCAERLIFYEEFSGNRIDTSKWTPQERFAGQPNFEFVTYLRHQDVIYVNRDHLSIEPKPITDIYGDTIFDSNLTLNLQADCTGELETSDCIRRNAVDIVPPIASGQITTKGYFSFSYGSVQIRAKLPDIPWSFVQFFLEPTDNAYGKYNFSSGQMRVAFVTGLDTCTLSGGIISKGSSAFRNQFTCQKSCSNNRKWSSDYHIYGLKWTPTSVTLSVNGEQYCNIDPIRKSFFNQSLRMMNFSSAFRRPATEMAPFDRPFHLTIGLGIGGHIEFDDGLPDKPWYNLDPRSMRRFWRHFKNRTYPRGKLEVDYIKVFTV
ncbi:unnamed protein product [Hermetia illucens]|uniref:Uncharacterized protein n=1 Tax=Hermetia illucens TaxID=343691 RepID=A0A7R8UK49_HERIL|nr:beta-1,3-glucan-binding protein-like [Hermetia illucens]CAD7082017.1 unnamed protein product [Hermetia illucens]